MINAPCIIWQIHDHKPGHMNQMRGLSTALADRMPVEIHKIAAPPRLTCWQGLLSNRFPPGIGLPKPDLIFGAGHRTHLAVLAARRAFGGRSVILMKPTLN